MKAQMPLKTLMSLVLTIVLFGSTALWASKFIGLSDKAMNDFTELVEKIEEVGAAEIGSIEYVPQLTMDKETAIIAFPKNSEAFWLVKEGVNWIKFEKPERLDKEKAYLCICKGTQVADAGTTWSCEKQMTCEEASVTFSKTNIALEDQRIDWEGFMLLRAKAASYGEYFGLGFLKDKTRTVYLEKIKDGEVALCRSLVEGHCPLNQASN
ncbi:hypothetical protein ACFLZ7_03075 [Nanoarchaeota archaeon]